MKKFLTSFIKVRTLVVIMSGAILLGSLIYGGYFTVYSVRLKADLENKSKEFLSQISQLEIDMKSLKNEDPRKKNTELQKEITNIENTYSKAVTVYEKLTDLRIVSKNVVKLDELFAKSLFVLSDRNFASSSAYLTDLSNQIDAEKQKIAAATAAAAVPANAPVSNTPPAAGGSSQQVSTPNGNFSVTMVAGDLSSTRVIVDTASDGDCGNNCPVLPLGTYVSRSGAYAGINGSYFCPASYPSCAGKTNSFDLLVMNKNKHYFNSDNNVYSNNPGVIFGGGYVRFVSAVSQWGRDTGIDGMLSNYPLLIEGGNVKFSSAGDEKQSGRGIRGFVANKGNTVYIGVVYNASVAEAAQALKGLGMENAMNLDSGGSTALWNGGYKVGPGRDIPNAILFVKK